jgi:mono/diheme cytochrome c family protein
VNFTQTVPRPRTTGPQQYPPIYLAQQAPVNLSPDDVQAGDQSQLVYKAPNPEAGQGIYASYCAHCHGLTGLGDGWDADYLDVKPANFHTADIMGLGEGDWFSRVSFGLQNSAMPMWNEWMPEQWRWNAIAYIQKYLMPMGPAGSGTIQPSIWQSSGGQVANNFLTLSQGDWTDEGNVIDPQQGQFLYNSYCSSCHGDKGTGIDPKNAPVGFAYPAPFPKDLPHSYVYQQIWQGVPKTPMISFRPYLSPGDVWDIVVYLLGNQPGG